MNVEIGAEAALFPEKEYIYGIFVAVLCISTLAWKIEENHPNFNDDLLAVLFVIYSMPPPSPPGGGEPVVQQMRTILGLDKQTIASYQIRIMVKASHSSYNSYSYKNMTKSRFTRYIYS
jgi:hypothetical protein